MKTLSHGVLGLLGIACLAPAALAHGGQYRGPGEVVPPANRNSEGQTSNGTSGGSTGPSSHASSSGGGAAGPCNRGGGSGGAAASPTARGAALSDDLTRWEFWWEFGKDPFLRLRDAVHGGRAIAADDALLNPRLAARAHRVDLPTEADLGRVADRIVALLQQGPGRDTTSACLVALAKIGRDGTSWKLRDELLPFLARNDQEMRETAALALGIAGRVEVETLAVLSSLVADDARGRKLSGDHAVNERTRAFAAFGLGLLLQRCTEVGPARRIVEALVPAIDDPTASRDLQVAAIEALSQFPNAWPGAGAAILREAVLDALRRFYDEPLGPGAQLVQAHVPPAIGRLLTAEHPSASYWRERFLMDLQSQLGGRTLPSGKAKTNPHIAQSCALALGSLTPEWNDDNGAAAEIGELLLATYRRHKDHQTRRFALLSLGRMGGDRARAALLREFDAAGKALEQPWAAMALGVLVAPARSDGYEVDPEIGTGLRKALGSSRNPSAQAGLALALGLVGDRAAGDDLRKLLRDKSHQDELAGYLCIALGLLRDDLATKEIRDLMQRSSRRSHVVFHCAQALGLLGDPNVVADLCAELEAGHTSLVRLSAASSALGQIGDRRAIEPLLDLLSRDGVTPLTRAFAVVGLGSVCDKDSLPWNATYATDCNYRASTSTLTDGGSGILDIL